MSGFIPGKQTLSLPIGEQIGHIVFPFSIKTLGKAIIYEKPTKPNHIIFDKHLNLLYNYIIVFLVLYIIC